VTLLKSLGLDDLIPWNGLEPRRHASVRHSADSSARPCWTLPPAGPQLLREPARSQHAMRLSTPVALAAYIQRKGWDPAIGAPSRPNRTWRTIVPEGPRGLMTGQTLGSGGSRVLPAFYSALLNSVQENSGYGMESMRLVWTEARN
jgi:hypothetical protein